MQASYLQATDVGADPHEKVPELSRRARGVPTWAVLRSLGRTGVAALVERLADAARGIADGVSALPGVEVLNDVVFTQVCIALDDDVGHRGAQRAALGRGRGARDDVALARSRRGAVLGEQLADGCRAGAPHRRRRRPGRSPTCARAFAERGPGSSVGGIRLNGGMAEALDAFSPATRAWFTESFTEPTSRAARGLAGDRTRRARTGRRAHRLGQDPRRLPLGHRPAARDRGGCRDLRHQGRLPLAAEGARRRRRTQPARPARRHRAHGGRARHGGARGERRGPLRRHAARRAPVARDASARDPHHHPRVPLPHAHVGGPRDAPRRRDGHRRRDPRARRHQAGGAPRPVARAARRAHRRAGAAHRALRHGAAPRGGRTVPRRHAAGQHRRAAERQAVRHPGHRAGRRPLRSRHRVRFGLRVAARGGGDPRRGARAPLHDRLRELAAPRRAPDGAPQRALGRTAGRTRRGGGGRRVPPDRLARWAPARAPTAGRGRRGVRDHRGSRARARPFAPRLRQQGGARARRGRPQGGPAALRRRDLEPRARHRHGRRRPRDAGGVAAVGRVGAAAHRSRRTPGRRGLEGRGLPQAPGRPAARHRGGRAHGRGRDRGHAGADEPARRARPADHRGRRGRRVGRGGRGSSSCVVRRRSPRCRGPRSTRRSTCSPGATRPTGSATCAPASCGIATPAPSSAAAARSDSR